ncbi:uncharacterized protein LOC118200323 [Stegodyphus dumicola]|uniref:uncharacterized protein LOC118200323 n=1 Tax=Stegodyphus dumicola TaxID=202533 RepID=UPI0015B04DE6|nr:uncharacterized protein LOC118200323 [Stegodyphus dumicola]
MEFILRPSLCRRSAISAIVALWNQKDIRCHILNYEWSSDINKKAQWRFIEDKVIENILILPITQFAKQSLLDLVQLIGSHIFQWKEFHLFLNINLPDSFCWTPYGTIDAKKTAEKLLKDENLSFVVHFRLACVYCIDSYIYSLWPQVQRYFTEKLIEKFILDESAEVIFWTFYLEGEMNKLMLLTEYVGNKNAFEYGLHKSCTNKWAVKYFVEKINEERKTKIIFNCAKHIVTNHWNRKTDTLILFLSYMNGNQQEEFFNLSAYGVLECFLLWPWQEFFLDIINTVWNSLSEIEYYNLLENVAHKISVFNRSHIYIQTFQELWNNTAQNYKNYIITKCYNGTYLSRLFMIKNTDPMIKLILCDATPEEKHKMIFYVEGPSICCFLYREKRLDSLKMLIKACIQSDDIMTSFKEIYQTHAEVCPYPTSSIELNNFFLLIDSFL